MKALHISPLFRPGRGGGSDYHLLMISRELMRHGVDVEFWSTRTESLQPTAAFSLNWPIDLPRSDSFDGLPIRRFTASRGLPRRAGQLISATIMRRWTREEHVGVPARPA